MSCSNIHFNQILSKKYHKSHASYLFNKTAEKLISRFPFSDSQSYPLKYMTWVHKFQAQETAVMLTAPLMCGPDRSQEGY